MFQILKVAIPILLNTFAISCAFSQMTTQDVESGLLTAEELITEVFLGEGVEVISVEFSGDNRAIGSFSHGGNAINIVEGITLTTGKADSTSVNPGPIGIGMEFQTSFTVDTTSDVDIDSILGMSMARDVQVFTIKFVPSSDSIKFNYVWASEEYPEYTCSDFNDAFGFFLSGPGINGPFENDGINIAMIPESNLPVAINSINGGSTGQFGDIENCTEPFGSLDFSQYYIDNFESQIQPVYDGFTTVLTAEAEVIPCQEYCIKLVIADANDKFFDSAVFLERGSFSSEGLVGFDLLYNYEEAVYESCEEIICINFYLNEELDSLPLNVGIDVDTSSTATEGEDFDGLPEEIVFENQNDTIQVCIDIIDNPDIEELEQIVINVEDMSLCDASMLTINIAQAPDVISIITGTESSCFGDSVFLSGENSIGLGELSFDWSTGDTTINIDFEIFQSSQYNLTVTDECGNTAESQFPIAVDTLLAVINGPDFGCVGETISLEVFSMGQIDSYEWSTGDTTSSIQATLEGEFDFSVTVTGCEEIILNWSISDEMCCSDPIAYYDLNECLASPGETAIYNEFQAQNMCPLTCGNTAASFLFREPASSNRHSCTPGFVNKAICVSALKECEYDAGSSKSIIIEIDITPDEGFGISIDSFSFYELAPEMYDWINGNSGFNDYPTFYGIRVLEGDMVLYEESDFETTQDWTKAAFVFDSITITEESTLRIELLAYCPIGNGGNVAVWDLDELSVHASCYALGMLEGEISGHVSLHTGEEIPKVTILLDRDNPNGLWIEETDDNGQFVFKSVPFEGEYILVPELEGDYMNGLSTYDIVLTQKHLLGRAPFDAPYDYIAADMNGDDKVTALDLIQMRKLILGNEADESYKDVWRFVEHSAEVSSDDPFSFKGYIELGELEAHEDSQNFYAIKLGDVSGDVQLDEFGNLEERNSEVILFSYNMTEMNGVSEFEIFVEEDRSVEGIQFCLEGQFEFSSDQIYIDGRNFRYSEGHTYFSWNGLETHISSDHSLFKLESNYIEELKINAALLSSEWIDHERIKRIEVSPIKIENLEVEVFPNPFSECVSFVIESNDSSVHIKLYSSDGRELYQSIITMDEVSKRIQLPLCSSDFNSNEQIIFYKVVSAGNSNVGKLIKH